MVQRGTAAEGVKASREHSKQDVMRGRMRRDWPENPSVPPSTRGMMVSGIGSPSESNSTRLLIIPLSHLKNTDLKTTLSPPGLNIIQPTNDYLKLPVKLCILILNFTMIRYHIHPRTSCVNEFRRTFRL